MCIPSERGRFAYFFCRYERTDEIKPQGAGFLSSSSNGLSVLACAMPLAPSFVHRLKRIGLPLMLSRDEAKQIQDAMTEEGQPILLAMADAVEGKAL